GLETAEIILDFDPPPIEVLFRSGLRPPNPVVSLNLDLLDSRISLDLRARNPLVGLNLDLLDARVGLDLHLIACLHEFVLRNSRSLASPPPATSPPTQDRLEPDQDPRARTRAPTGRNDSRA